MLCSVDCVRKCEEDVRTLSESRHVVTCRGEAQRPMTKPLKYCYTDRCARNNCSIQASFTATVSECLTI